MFCILSFDARGRTHSHTHDAGHLSVGTGCWLLHAAWLSSEGSR